jgi:RNA polymerase sigma-70 factor (ECF subfamily)
MEWNKKRSSLDLFGLIDATVNVDGAWPKSGQEIDRLSAAKARIIDYNDGRQELGVDVEKGENGRKFLGAPSHSAVVDLIDRQVKAEIVAACRAGDRDAFRALYDTYKDRVFSIALYFFHGDPLPASDVTQQVFLKLMTGMSHFRGDAEFSTWLYRLVVNACTDAARRRKAEARSSDLLETVAGPASQEEDYARAQMARSVRAAVSALPPKFRIAVLLRYFEDLSYEQMAEALHCSIGTVASRLSRGHKMLAERLKGLNV